jgi:hypothetical protein
MGLQTVQGVEIKANGTVCLATVRLDGPNLFGEYEVDGSMFKCPSCPFSMGGYRRMRDGRFFGRCVDFVLYYANTHAVGSTCVAPSNVYAELLLEERSRGIFKRPIESISNYRSSMFFLRPDVRSNAPRSHVDCDQSDVNFVASRLTHLQQDKETRREQHAREQQAWWARSSAVATIGALALLVFVIIH